MGGAMTAVRAPLIGGAASILVASRCMRPSGSAAFSASQAAPSPKPNTSASPS